VPELLKTNLAVLKRRGDSTHLQMQVAKHYDLPHVSAIDGIGPLSTPEARSWFNASFLADKNCHISILGHQMVAVMIQNVLLIQYSAAKSSTIPGSPLSRAWLPPLLVASEKDVEALSYRPFSLDFRTRDRTASIFVKSHTFLNQGFQSISDVPKKPGMIASAPGSRIVFKIPENELQAYSNLQGSAHVELLKSYEHMGVANVTVHLTSASPCTLEGAVVISSLLVDCLWEDRVSESNVVILPVESSAPLLKDSTCLYVSVEVAESGRTENKIKLLDILIH